MPTSASVSSAASSSAEWIAEAPSSFRGVPIGKLRHGTIWPRQHGNRENMLRQNRWNPRNYWILRLSSSRDNHGQQPRCNQSSTISIIHRRNKLQRHMEIILRKHKHNIFFFFRIFARAKVTEIFICFSNKN